MRCAVGIPQYLSLLTFFFLAHPSRFCPPSIVYIPCLYDSKMRNELGHSCAWLLCFSLKQQRGSDMTGHGAGHAELAKGNEDGCVSRAITLDHAQGERDHGGDPPRLQGPALLTSYVFSCTNACRV